jgi:hypothetical protein
MQKHSLAISEDSCPEFIQSNVLNTTYVITLLNKLSTFDNTISLLI